VHGAHVDVDDLLAAVDGGDDGPRSLGAVGDVDADVRQTPGGPKGTVGVQLKTGTFTWDALVVDAPAKANGSFAVQRDGDVALTGVSASAVRARYGPLVGTEATARLHYADDRLTFDRLHFHAAEGVWSHTGWFMLAERGRFAGQLGVEGVAPHALAAMLDETELELPFERIDFDGEFHGLAISEWKSALLMSGSVYLSDGTLQSANILRPIWNALVGGGWMRSEVDRPTRVQEVSASFILRQGQFDTTDLSLVSDDYRVTGAGSVDMSGALDLQTRIQLTASGMQKMFLFAALPLPTGNLPSLPPIPARVSGTLDAPVIRPNVAALPSATARWFVDAVLNTPLSMGDAVVRRLENVWNGVGRLFGGGAAEEPAAAAD
jgi:hypothetical protein